MNAPTEISQLLLLRTADGPAIVARSDGIDFALEEFARQTAVAFGDRPESIASFESVFALPAGNDRVAVVTASASAKEPGFTLAFRFLFLPRSFYRWHGDPFALAAEFPLNAAVRGALPTLTPSIEPRPPRLVAAVQRVLQTGDSPLLLGAAQALLDGARIRIVRSQPDAQFVRGLWQLLPDSARGEHWPCDYCFSDALPFHAAAVSDSAMLQPGSLDEEGAKDYPEGRYELAVQAAAEAGDQAALDGLFARPSPQAVLRTALVVLAFALFAIVAMKFF